MHILIYCDSLQADYCLKLKDHYPNMTEIKNTHDLQHAYYESYNPILVLISQPTKPMMEALLALNWFRIICHIGIREVKHSKLTGIYFENDMAFKSIVEKALADQNSERLLSYLNQFEGIDEDDMTYLEELSGLSLKKRKRPVLKKKRFTKRKGSIHKGLITVMGSSEIAAEIAKSIARHTRGKVLIIDGDLLKPSMDQHFGISNLQTPIKSHITGIDNTGINIALDTMVKGFDLGQGINAFTKHGGHNLRVMLGNYNIHNYEYYDEKQIKLLLSKLGSYFHNIVLSVGENPYDSLSMLGLHISDINIVASQKTVADIRFKHSLIEILAVKQGLPHDKNLVLTYDGGGHSYHVGVSAIKCLFNKSYIGHYHQKQRAMPRWLDKISERMRLWD